MRCRPVQVKANSGSAEPTHNVILKLTFFVYIMLVIKTLVLNIIFMFEKRSLFSIISERQIVNSAWK